MSNVQLMAGGLGYQLFADEGPVEPDADGYISVTEAQNPVTRFMVALDPPFRYKTEEQVTAFRKHFDAWCVAMWDLARMDPRKLSSPRGWIDGPEECRVWVPPEPEQ